MWFLYVVVGLVLLIISGFYARRRIAGALAHVGVADRPIRVVRWTMVWLLFGYPVLVILTVLGSRVLGRATMPRLDGLVASWLLAIPFAWALLVVLQSTPWLVAIDLVYVLVGRRRRTATAARRRALAVLAAVGAFAVYTPARILLERGELRVRHHDVGAPASGPPPLRIGFVADVQQDVHTDADRAREVYAMVNAHAPDIVLSGGDWINTGPDYIESAAAAAGTLKSRLGTFSVRGDHEHFAYVDRERSVSEIERAMRSHGVTMLSNEVRWFEHCGKRIAVAFLNDNYIHRTDRATIEALIASTKGADYTIAVTHQLNRKLAAVLENHVNLVLAGHTHGGQVNPVLGILHVNLALLETDLVDGRYQLGTTAVIVTAGIGTSVVPIRYAAPGSVELIDLWLPHDPSACGRATAPAAH